jgi:hypothetical protein
LYVDVWSWCCWCTNTRDDEWRMDERMKSSTAITTVCMY